MKKPYKNPSESGSENLRRTRSREEKEKLRVEMASNGVEDKTKLAIVTALCKRLSLDPGSFSSEEMLAGNDIQTLFSNMKLTGDGAPVKNNEEVMKWVAFADNFPVDSGARFAILKELNEELVVKSVLLGNGLTPSEADIVVFSVLHPFVSGLSATDGQNYPNVLRWIDYIQNKEDVGSAFEKIPLEKSIFAPQESTKVGKGESDLNPGKAVQSTKTVDKVKEEPSSKKSDKSEAGTKNKKSGAETSKVSEEKKKVPEKESVDKDAEVSASLLNIQVGLIRKAWKHPSADSLLVEEIDLGEGNVRQVVSGLAKFCSPDDLTNRLVALITNVKPGKLRDVMSAGLVLCASNQDHSSVEPLLPPAGAKVGERVMIAGHDGKPEDVLNPKKKQLDKITPHLYTDDKGVATFKGIPFMTSAGPCTSSISNGSVK